MINFTMHIIAILPSGDERHMDVASHGDIGDIGTAVAIALETYGITHFHSLVISYKPVAQKAAARPALRVVTNDH